MIESSFQNADSVPTIQRVDDQETRRRNLAVLMRTQYGNVQKRLAEAIGRDANYVSNLFHARTPFGEKVARDIERKLKLEKFALDREEARPYTPTPAIRKLLAQEPPANYLTGAPSIEDPARRAAIDALLSITQDLPLVNLHELIGDAKRKRDNNLRILEEHYAQKKDAA